MTRRKDTDKLQKHTLFLRAGDFDKLAELIPSLPPSTAARKIISGFVDKHLAEPASATLPPVTLPEN